MVNKAKIIIFGISTLLVLNIALNFSPSTARAEDIEVYKTVNSLELVGTPQPYLNTKIKICATFNKFSTLGLDYKPAFKDSKDYISFLINRPDGPIDHPIPLSELKLLIKRTKAEKLIDLENGDKIELSGQVFSSALGDPWVDVDNINVLSGKAKAALDKKATANDKQPAKK